MKPPSAAQNTLKRELGLLDAVGVGIGAIVGAGIFVVSGVAAAIAGTAFILSFALAAVVALFNGLSSAELAVKYPRSGGTYEYAYELLGPWQGFSAGWLFIASKLAAGGTVAIGFGAYMAQLVPQVPPVAGALGAVTALTIANLLGIRKAGTLNLVIVAVVVGTLTFFVVAGIPFVQAENFTPFFTSSPISILQAAGLVFFAFTGYARIATLGEEVREPRKTIPKAIALTLAITTLLFLCVVTVATGLIGAAGLGAASSPLVSAAQQIPISGMVAVIGVGAACALLGVLLSQILGISRVMLAMGRRNDLPPGLASVDKKFGVPSIAVVVTGCILALLAIFGSLDWIIAASTFCILFYYFITNFAAMRLQGQDKLFPRWLAYAGAACCLVLALSLPLEVVIAGAGLLALGIAVRLLMRFLFAR